MDQILASFFATVDTAELAEQRRWLVATIAPKALHDRPGRRLLKQVDSLPTIFDVTRYGDSRQQQLHWQAIDQMKAWLELASHAQGHAPQGEGLLSLLDAVQDLATDRLGVAESVIFPRLRFQLHQQAEQGRVWGLHQALAA